ncbi:MAG: hypothetical protein Kow0059_22270 [Candidatus Sumerlaeia bacterium]
MGPANCGLRGEGVTMTVFKITISRKILLLVGFVSLVSGLAGIVPLYLGSFTALERAFSNLLITSTQGDASLLNDYLKRLESQLNLLDERFVRMCFECISACDQAEQEKRLTSFRPLSLRNLKDSGLGAYEPLLAAAGERGYLAVVNARGRPGAVSADVFPFNLSEQPWWSRVAEVPATGLFYAQLADERLTGGGGARAYYLLLIKPLWGEGTESPERRFVGAVVLALDARDLFQRAIGLTSLRQISNMLISSDGEVIYQPGGAPRGVTETIQSNLSDIQTRLTGWYWAQMPGSRILMAHAAVNTLRLHAHDNRSNVEWFVVEFVDVSEAVNKNNTDLWKTVLLGLVLIALLVLLGAAISYRIVKPVKSLHRGVERLRRGDLDYRVQVRTGDELEELADSFNRMAQTLKETYDELEFKIRETDEKRRQLAIINEVIKATTQALDAERTFEIIAREVGRLVPYDRMSLSFIHAERQEVEFVYVIPPQRDTLPRGYRVPLQKSLISMAVAQRMPVVISLSPDAHTECDDARVLYEAGARSALVVPLVAQSGIIGTLNLASESPRQYGKREIDLILQVADTLAVSIEHAALYTRVSRFAEELEIKVQERTAALESAQQKLIQTEKFAATGRLAANIAHEINNPLGIIKNYLYLLSESIERGCAPSGRPPAAGGRDGQAASGPGGTGAGEDDLRQCLRIIREEIDRIARIVRRLLDFYKRPESRPVPTDINREVEEMFYLMRKGFKRKQLSVEKDLAAALPPIMASPDKIRQVILNLLRNAEDAVGDDGRIRIATGVEQRRDERTGRPRDFVVLTVADNGCGIPEGNLDKIFDPFFTTKQEIGTGLGLSITYGIVESLGGWIEVDSREGAGTTFRCYFPIEPLQSAAAEAEPAAAQVSAEAVGGEPESPPRKSLETAGVSGGSPTPRDKPSPPPPPLAAAAVDLPTSSLEAIEIDWGEDAAAPATRTTPESPAAPVHPESPPAAEPLAAPDSARTAAGGEETGFAEESPAPSGPPAAPPVPPPPRTASEALESFDPLTASGTLAFPPLPGLGSPGGEDEDHPLEHDAPATPPPPLSVYEELFGEDRRVPRPPSGKKGSG